MEDQAYQSSDDEDFGIVSMNLAYGHHDVKIIASRGELPELTDDALTWGRVKDTYAIDYPVDVVASSNGNRSPELKRAISGLRVVISDEIPTNAKWIVLTLGKRSQALTLPALSALPYGESSVELDCTGSRGVKNAQAAIYTLAGEEEWTSTAHIAVKDATGKVITSFDLPDVTLKKNRMTVLTGEVFNRQNGFTVSLDDAWDTDKTGVF